MTQFPDDAEWESSDTRVGPTHRDWRAAIGWILLLGAVAGTIVVGTFPAPYVIERPGPAYNTLGQVDVSGDKVSLIDIPGQKTYATKGDLDLLTVYLDGSREAPVNWITIAAAWFNPSRAVVPVDAVFPAGETQDEADKESTIDMQNSQKEAVAAALGELDISYDSSVVVAGVVKGQPADGVLQRGDTIVTVNGTRVSTPDEVRDLIKANGVDAELTIGIDRDGAQSTVHLTPTLAADGKTPVIGIYPQGDYSFPFKVNIQLDNVGGPSAGMMFALGIYDKLTPGALTGGARIAGTGTIAADGAVGPIGGIRQKMYGAKDAGATWFLAPADNCDEVVGHVPAGLTVFKVATLDDSIAAVEAIADHGDTSKLATCTTG